MKLKCFFLLINKINHILVLLIVIQPQIVNGMVNWVEKN